ncbi:MAG: OmpH family outer membrane protein [Coxiellaceae bacterium]|jgi:outer membrane protein|nr:OmpH family outer membrane protein [Coxiellaceae bacterium]
MKKIFTIPTFFLLLSVSVFAGLTTTVVAGNDLREQTVSVSETRVFPKTRIVARIGVIDLNKVLLDSSQLADAKTKLKKRFGPYEKELDDLQRKFRTSIEMFSKNSPTMKSDDQKKEQQKIIAQQKELQEKQAKFQEDVTAAQNDVMKSVIKKVEEVVAKVAVEEQLDLVITKASLVYNKKEFDITNSVSKRLKE